MRFPTEADRGRRPSDDAGTSTNHRGGSQPPAPSENEQLLLTYSAAGDADADEGMDQKIDAAAAPGQVSERSGGHLGVAITIDPDMDMEPADVPSDESALADTATLTLPLTAATTLVTAAILGDGATMTTRAIREYSEERGGTFSGSRSISASSSTASSIVPEMIPPMEPSFKPCAFSSVADDAKHDSSLSIEDHTDKKTIRPHGVHGAEMARLPQKEGHSPGPVLLRPVEPLSNDWYKTNHLQGDDGECMSVTEPSSGEQIVIPPREPLPPHPPPPAVTHDFDGKYPDTFSSFAMTNADSIDAENGAEAAGAEDDAAVAPPNGVRVEGVPPKAVFADDGRDGPLPGAFRVAGLRGGGDSSDSDAALGASSSSFRSGIGSGAVSASAPQALPVDDVPMVDATPLEGDGDDEGGYGDEVDRPTSKGRRGNSFCGGRDRRVVVVCVVAACAMAAAAAVVAAVLLPAPPPTDGAPPPNDGDVLFWREMLSNANISGTEVLDDPTTPQHAALRWAANGANHPVGARNISSRIIQRYLLAVLFHGTGGATSWTFRCNFLTARDECEWSQFVDKSARDSRGVTLCDDDGRVISLRLDDNNLSGELPAEIGHIYSLQELILSNTNRGHVGLEGKLPVELGQLREMRVLNLSGNMFSNSIPSELGALEELETLDLSANSLSGEIPTVLGSLTQLTLLGLRSNELTGTVPSSLSKMKSATSVSLDMNRITGSASFLCEDLAQLEALSVDRSDVQCSCCRCCPSVLDDVKGIVTPILPDASVLRNEDSPQAQALFWLANQDTAVIRFDDKRRVVQRYVLASFYLDTGAEKWIARCNFLSRMHECDWNEHDNIAGKLVGVSACDSNGYISNISLGKNWVGGTLPRELGALTTLIELDLAGATSLLNNHLLTGTIPSEIANLTRLQLLNLADNDLTGPIPSQLYALGELTELKLDFSYSAKGGNLDPVVALTKLQTLYWPRGLTGTLPTLFGTLKNMQKLHLGGLLGTLPSELGRLTRLQVLGLGNSLTGTVPTEFGLLTNLVELNMDENDLVGSIEFLCSTQKMVEITVDKTEVNCSCCNCC